MVPNAPQDQSPLSASLPPMPAPGSIPVPVAPGPSASPAAPAGGGIDTPQAIAQAKQLVAQYGHDPYRLSGALQQLKAAYLAQQFHVIPNSVEN